MLVESFDTDATARPRLRIGDWWADAATNELSRDGEVVRVEPKAMAVLMLLADRAGHVVSRDALFSALWPGVVVGDEALTQSIIKLRKALGDNPRSPSYIQTISKRGYRLIAPVRAGGVAPAPAGGVESATAGDVGSAATAGDVGSATAGDVVAPVGGGGDPVLPSPRRRSRSLIGGLLAALVVALLYLLHALPPRGPATDAGDAGDEPQPALTLTVQPFESLGADDGQTYLARGISNDLTTDLSRLPGLRLISASTSASGNRTVRSARYLVSGSVQRLADTLRINVRLVDTETNQQLWSERFERPFGDLFAVQDEIIRSLTALLPGKIADAARQRLAHPHTRSLEAYDYFLRGQALFLVRQADENERARALYRKALELDPKFARAYAGLAMTYAMDNNLPQIRDSSPGLVRAFELAETARLIDPDIPEVHWALGFVHAQNRRHEQAVQSLQRAIELNRSYADAYALMGGIYTYVGKPSKSIPLLRTALRLNPDGGSLYFLLLGRAYLFENDIEQALINLREAAARNPVNLETRIYLAAALGSQDRSAAAWEAEEIRVLEPGFSLQTWLENYPLTSAPHKARLVELLAMVPL